jgi:hypothetical protein
MKLRNLLALAVVVLPTTFATTANAEGDSPWMPIPGTLGIGLTYTDQYATEYFKTNQYRTNGVTEYVGEGDQLTLEPDQDYRFKTGYLKFTYGISENLAASVLFGYSDAFARTEPWYTYTNSYRYPPEPKIPNRPLGAANHGVMDTHAGIKWRIVDEFNHDVWPTITLVTNAIIKGSYETQTQAAVGKGGGGGYEVALLFGKQFGADYSLSFEIGTQRRGKELRKDRTYTYPGTKKAGAMPGDPGTTVDFGEKEFQVPPAIFMEVIGDWMFADEWSIYIGMSNKAYKDNGYHLGGAKAGLPTSPTDSPHYRPGSTITPEERTVAKAGLNWAFSADQGAALHYGRVVNYTFLKDTIGFGNRNTIKDKWIISLSYDIVFTPF